MTPEQLPAEILEAPRAVRLGPYVDLERGEVWAAYVCPGTDIFAPVRWTSEQLAELTPEDATLSIRQTIAAASGVTSTSLADVLRHL